MSSHSHAHRVSLVRSNETLCCHFNVRQWPSLLTPALRSVCTKWTKSRIETEYFGLVQCRELRLFDFSTCTTQAIIDWLSFKVEAECRTEFNKNYELIFIRTITMQLPDESVKMFLPHYRFLIFRSINFPHNGYLWPWWAFTDFDTFKNLR